MTNTALGIPGYEVETELRRNREDTGRGVGGGLLVNAREGLRLYQMTNKKTAASSSSAILVL